MWIVLLILSRWLNVISACVAIGSVFFVRVVIPAGLAALQPAEAQAATAPIRRRFKIVMHSAICLLILTGVINTLANWSSYNRDPALLQPLWGLHVLLALSAFSIALYLLAGAAPRPRAASLLAANLLVLALVVLAASTVKWARERAFADHSSIAATRR